MLTDAVDDAADIDPETLHERYVSELAVLLEDHGISAVAERTGIDLDRLRALPERDPDLTLEETASILAATGAYPDTETAVQDVRDHLLIRMSSAIVDVDALAVALDDDLGPQEYQQKIEGRMETTLSEYARIYHYVESENPY